LADKIDIIDPPRFASSATKLKEDAAKLEEESFLRQRIRELEIENAVLMKVLGK